MLNFDDLFNDFFNSRSRKNDNDFMSEQIKKFIESLSNFNISENQELIEKEIENKLGKPNVIERRIENGMLYEKLTWHTPYGSFVKVIVSDDAENKTSKVTVNESNNFKPEKSLEEQLKEAVELENYELAIQLRDKIKGTKKRTRKNNKKTL